MADLIPAATTSVLIPIGDLSLADRATMRAEVDANLVEFAIQKRITTDPKELVVRDTEPFTDLGLTGSSNGEDWLIPGAATAGTLLQYFNRTLSQTQAIAFYGAGSPMAAPQVSALKFFFGSTQAQTRAYYNLEKLWLRLETDGYFGTPLFWGPQEVVTVSVMPISNFAAGTERLILHARTVEQFGQTISAKNATVG